MPRDYTLIFFERTKHLKDPSYRIYESGDGHGYQVGARYQGTCGHVGWGDTPAEAIEAACDHLLGAPRRSDGKMLSYDYRSKKDG